MTITSYNQRFSSSDLNAPGLTGQTGAGLKVLNACLVDGFGYSGVSITSITRSGTTATATCSAADIMRLQTGHILTISGATGGDATLYNGTFTITVASTTTFTYTMTGTPTGSATGTLVFSTFLPITGITRVGAIALVALTNANSTTFQGDYFTVSGAAQSDYNVTAAINVYSPWVALTAYTLGALVTNSSNTYICRTAGTTAGSGGPTGTGTAISDGSCTWDYVDTSANASKYFSYTVANTPTTPATGTIVYAKSGLQWTRPLSGGTNAQSYQSQDATLGPCLYLQVVDNAAQSGGAKELNVWAAEVLTADQTANNGGGANSGRFPTIAQFSTGLAWLKSSTADTTQRPWNLWGDARTFFFRFYAQGTGTPSATQSGGFGHFVSEKSGDAFNTFILGGTAFNSASNNGMSQSNMSGSVSSASTGFYIARSYSQLGSAVQGGMVAPVFTSVTFPNPENNGVYCSPVFVGENAANVRGRLPGLYYSWHAPTTLTDGDIWQGLTNLASGHKLEVVSVSHFGSASGVLIDRNGPWNP
jgi:hypothetical protein